MFGRLSRRCNSLRSIPPRSCLNRAVVHAMAAGPQSNVCLREAKSTIHVPRVETRVDQRDQTRVLTTKPLGAVVGLARATVVEPKAI
jgi:hypothetical protein